MSDDAWDKGWSDSDESAQPQNDGLLSRIGSWLTGKSPRQEETGDESFSSEIEAARQRVQEYRANGQADEHRDRLEETRYRSSFEYAVAAAIERLEQHLSHYDEACSRFGPDAMLSQELWAQRIATLNHALSETEPIVAETKQAYDILEGRWQRGEVSQAEYDDLHHRLARKEQRASTRLGLGGLGGSYEEIGGAGDQSGHILEDSLSDDGGEMRQKIAMKIRSMPRRTALKILEQAVADGVISQETADYLVRDCVRPS